MRSSICSNYISKAQQNNNDNNVHEEKRTKDTEGPTFFLNQLFLAASRFWVSWCNIHEIVIWKFLNVYYLNHIDLKLSEYTLFKSYYLLIPWFLFWFITGIRSHNSSQLNPFMLHKDKESTNLKSLVKSSQAFQWNRKFLHAILLSHGNTTPKAKIVVITELSDGSNERAYYFLASNYYIAALLRTRYL